ncbi:YafY family protein [Nocardioides sp. R-C-SC26]|uniref:helix-turn-helix transcriptional regulator n=1 Tax=Nocardioides sp. R-C-SC26 TaxID=2870414 RepID=UPI001E5A2DEB|nr:WYL domain-containing protein [Nocardioides sp. R-C-SC26]
MSAVPGGAATSKEQVARLLALVPYFHARESVRLAEAAADLGVTPEQVVKDLKVLFMCGLPGGYPDDLIDVDLDALVSSDGKLVRDGVVRIGNADYLTRPMRLTPTEASAMIVALRALRAGADGETTEIVDRVLGKLESAAAGGGATTAVAVHATPDVEPDPREQTMRTTLAEAISHGVQVTLDYYVPARDEVSRRVVDPHELSQRAGYTYLDAYCHAAEAPRSFRLDRIAEIEVSPTPISTERQGPRSLEDGLFSGTDNATLVTLRLQAPARWVVEYYSVEEVRPAPEGGGAIDVDLRVADERWLTRLLLRLAPHAEVVHPTTFGAEFTAAAQATLAWYRPGSA